VFGFAAMKAACVSPRLGWVPPKDLDSLTREKGIGALPDLTPSCLSRGIDHRIEVRRRVNHAPFLTPRPRPRTPAYADASVASVGEGPAFAIRYRRRNANESGGAVTPSSCP